MIHALLLCNGEPPGATLCRRLARKSDLIVAADGGANTARRFGIRPDVIIGDLDSISTATRRHFRSTSLLKIARQDNTDLEKALAFAEGQRVDRVTILGATGRRIDFTLGNLSVIWNHVRLMDITVAGDGWFAKPIVGRLELRVKKGTMISLIPFGSCSGITLKGLRFPLTNAIMRIGEIGVSNVATRTKISVRVRRGKMLLIIFGNPKHEIRISKETRIPKSE